MRKVGILLLSVVGAFALVLKTGVLEKDQAVSKQTNNEYVQYMSSEPGGS
ncbi:MULTISPECIES: hypothetical protein [Bacillus]|nr:MULTISPECIES: hypothetical protein [Bacillus]MEB9337000.1 hypothetical protein [Bacillus cereus]CCW09317.1 hypothetical protein EBGED10_60620 [Bacillus sp. GeD10]HEF1856297.1 hypothetical protein [Bacillus cereus]HEF1868681.1 hypothetical protein [Bacillus cereus]HEF1879185.1 hypothetical protein [Bacillus cereus]